MVLYTKEDIVLCLMEKAHEKIEVLRQQFAQRIFEEELEDELDEKYVGFKKLEKGLEAKGDSADSAGAIAASIGRKKYGKGKFQKASASGHKMGESEDEILEADVGKVKVTFSNKKNEDEVAQFVAEYDEFPISDFKIEGNSVTFIFSEPVDVDDAKRVSAAAKKGL